jgi:hypothetical protein
MTLKLYIYKDKIIFISTVVITLFSIQSTEILNFPIHGGDRVERPKEYDPYYQHTTPWKS